ncbi:hypothetical protein LOC71_09890 [Rhodopirellula sp. JC740]|uniref:Uncharacterized protein n=1 Tax=Rhodopirellula halodulae TaxID=2894198 RepID=A0ABS8NGC5_9BACT|nr:hypothetical protein [Rhodopirellula sp. JC740]MCC9642585.1 hypothetical protein [Rhodopirellula sp. JC740]
MNDERKFSREAGDHRTPRPKSHIAANPQPGACELGSPEQRATNLLDQIGWRMDAAKQPPKPDTQSGHSDEPAPAEVSQSGPLAESDTADSTAEHPADTDSDT